MERREALQWIAGAIGIPALAGISPERLGTLGRGVHQRLATSSSRPPRLVLNAHQDRTITVIAEHIIPETDTPGAAAANVNGFVDLILSEWLDEAEQQRFLTGLTDVDAQSLDRFGAAFADTTEAQQIALLTELDAELNTLLEAEDSGAEVHFFGRMKWFTVFGYYTSEIGQTQELQSEIIPGRYDPCGPLHRDTPGEW